MTDTFKPGDLAIVIRATKYPHYVGRSCTVLSELMDAKNIHTGKLYQGYMVDIISPVTGRGHVCYPECLRKIPPHNHPAQFDAEIWTPKDVVVNETEDLNDKFEALVEKARGFRHA